LSGGIDELTDLILKITLSINGNNRIIPKAGP
jgi:hypothetical protein